MRDGVAVAALGDLLSIEVDNLHARCGRELVSLAYHHEDIAALGALTDGLGWRFLLGPVLGRGFIWNGSPLPRIVSARALVNL